MRVIAGCAKGHKLVAPDGLETRPTTDRIKETLFNIISNDIEDSIFLDLFSGSGAIAIEALSRGASYAVLVDSSEESGRIIGQNLSHTKFNQKALVINKDVFTALEELRRRDIRFNVVYMDPPYKEEYITPVLIKLKELDILTDNCIIIVERGSDTDLSHLSGYNVIKEKKFKTTIISFLSLEE